MAKSQIIKDLANSTIDLGTALKRAKVLFNELGNEKLLNWVNYEISGYPDYATLPDYRHIQGTLHGSYFIRSVQKIIQFNSVSIPLGKMPDNERDAILEVNFYEGINALNHLISSGDSNDRIGKAIPADFYSHIIKYNNNPFMVITSASVIVSSHNVANIFSIVENRLLDSLILLEKEFGNLDELDIDTSGKSSSEIEEIANKITVLVYNDNRVTIGDGNKIKDSSINTLNE